MNDRRGNTDYDGLAFLFGDMIREIDHMCKLAGPFLDRDSYQFVIPEWKGSLERFRSNPMSGRLCWQIPKRRPIQTAMSEGDYQPDAGGGRCVVGELCVVWEIECARPPRKKPSARIEEFVVSGNASTLVRILEVAEEEEGLPELARWTFDIGARDSPGCHFHTHIGWGMSEQVSSPVIDVPRFPNLLVTPMDALEFLLAELFQEKWTEHATKEATKGGWPAIQRRRLQKLLEWHYHEIRNVGGSPWTSFKARKPARDMLVGEPSGLV
jgi:hypothetical protein